MRNVALAFDLMATIRGGHVKLWYGDKLQTYLHMFMNYYKHGDDANL